jgi:hypothetical protein
MIASRAYGILEGVIGDAFRGGAGDDFDALDDALDNLMLDARVFALGVFSDNDSVDVLVQGRMSGNAPAGSDVGIQVECLAKRQVQRDVPPPNGSQQWTLQGDLIALNDLQGLPGDGPFAALWILHGLDIDDVPVYGYFGDGKDPLHALADLGSDAVTRDQSHLQIRAGRPHTLRLSVEYNRIDRK